MGITPRRQFGWSVLFLAGLLFLGTRLLVGQEESGAWRRTAQGWVQLREFPAPMRTPVAARLHPGLVATFVTLASVAALLGGPERGLGPPPV